MDASSAPGPSGPGAAQRALFIPPTGGGDGRRVEKRPGEPPDVVHGPRRRVATSDGRDADVAQSQKRPAAANPVMARKRVAEIVVVSDGRLAWFLPRSRLLSCLIDDG